MPFVRAFLFWVVFSLVAHWLVKIYSRSLRAEKLEKRWDREKPEGIGREEYVAAGLKDYEKSLRRRLIFLVYVVPFVVIFGTIYYVNYVSDYR